MRSKRMAILWADSVNGSDFTTEKTWDKDLDNYAAARKEGIQPRSTSRVDVEQARMLSDIAGKGVDYGKADLGL